MKSQENFKKGAVEMVVLHLLCRRNMYGYELVQELEKSSNGLFIIKEGTLYPSLYRMIEKKYISGSTELVGKKRTRVYYTIEEEGKKALEEMKKDYELISMGITNVLNSKSEE
ncbi:MAG: PadR family transcriptional regulator [Ruminococcus sp.]|nr:PadR family transcriptional regulator [Ruminococcus sp.]MBO5383803.1 PadR family transcriptional regulator [Ruminococcus sp.]MBR6670238.1 PadR family transcriptional regulator [Ruminococcus sp.]